MLDNPTKDKMVKKFSKKKVVNQQAIEQNQPQQPELITKVIKQAAMIRGRFYNIGDEIQLTPEQTDRFSKQGYV